MGYLGTLAYLRGNLARAKEYYLKTLAIQEKHGSATDVAMTLQNLASVLKDKGELSGAEKLLRRAATLQANAAPHSIEFAQTLDTLGSRTANAGQATTGGAIAFGFSGSFRTSFAKQLGIRRLSTTWERYIGRRTTYRKQKNNTHLQPRSAKC